MTSSATCTDVKTATDILTEYHLDPHRDDDETRWRGDVTTGDFRMWKQALQSRNVENVQHILDNHSDSPELSCTYNHPWNESRWWYGANFVMNQSFKHEVIVEIGAGSHARVAQQVLLKKPTKCYIICDLVSPLLVAYHNMSKHVQVHYVRPSDNMETLVEQHDCIMLPHHLADKLYTMSRAVFYNSYSLSEMSEHEIHHYMDIITTTSSRLLSENYMTGTGKCHLCDEPYRALGDFMPSQLEVLASLGPPTPTNTGSQLLIAQA